MIPTVDYNELVRLVREAKAEMDRLGGELMMAEERYRLAVENLDYAIYHDRPKQPERIQLKLMLPTISNPEPQPEPEIIGEPVTVRQKHKRCCSVCGEPGHNSRTHPGRDNG